MPAIAFETADLGRTACSERDDAVRERLAALQSRPFDLLQGPPWRVALLGLDARTHVLAVVMHHILSDGASMQLWVAEWLEAYGARRQGLPARGMPPLQYIDYAAWAAGRLEAGEGERQWAWWRERLAHWHAAPCEVRPDHPRPPRAAYTARRHAFEVPAAVVQGLRALQAREGATSFMVLLAALQVLLSRYTGQPRVRVGAAVAQRGVPGVDGLVGLFVNTLVLPGTVGPQATLLDVLRDARELVLGAQAHQELPFDRLVEALRPERSAGREPAVPGHAQPPGGGRSAAAGGAGARRAGRAAAGAAGAVRTGAGGARARHRGAVAHLGPRGRTVRAGHHRAAGRPFPGPCCRRWPKARSSRPARWSGSRPPSARSWTPGAATTTARARPCRFFRQLEAHAARQPRATALLFGDEALGYGELNARANRLAHHLLREGLRPQSLVGICMQRSVEMIVGMLAAMKAGCAYLPLDPELPAGRLGDMLEHSGAAWCCRTRRRRGRCPCCRACA